MPPNSQLLAESRGIIYAEPEQGHEQKKLDREHQPRLEFGMHTKEHIEPLIVRVSA